MCPPSRPGRGSGSVPAKRPALRASTTCSARLARFARTAARSRTSSGRGRAANVRGAGCASPASTGRPSRRHLRRPPSSTATASWPKARKVHHTRAALTTPRTSYTMMRSPLPSPSAPTAAAKASAPGSMCGSVVVWSAIASMSKKTAPGMWAARNSARASRPSCGMCQVPSTTRTSGSSRCLASHSVVTSASMIYGFGAARRFTGLRPWASRASSQAR